MKKLELIAKLREVRQDRGATEAEEKIAAEKIGRLLMESPEIVTLEAAQVQPTPDDYIRAFNARMAAMNEQIWRQTEAFTRAQYEAMRQSQRYSTGTTSETSATDEQQKSPWWKLNW